MSSRVTGPGLGGALPHDQASIPPSVISLLLAPRGDGDQEPSSPCWAYCQNAESGSPVWQTRARQASRSQPVSSIAQIPWPSPPNSTLSTESPLRSSSSNPEIDGSVNGTSA